MGSKIFNRCWLTTALLAGILIAGGYLFLSGENTSEPSTHAAPAEVIQPAVDAGPDAGEQALEDPGNLPSTRIVKGGPATSSIEREVIERYRTASSARAAFEQIERAREEDLELLVLSFESQLAGDCHGMGGWAQPLHERTRWAWEKLREYCSDYDPVMIQSSHEYLAAGNTPISIAFMQDLNRFVTNLSFEEKAAELSTYLANTRYPVELEAGGYYLRDLQAENTGRAVPLGQDEDVPFLEVPDIQTDALWLTECRIFGGCGPNDVKLLTICFLTGNCDEGWSFEDYMRGNLSPLQYEQVDKISRNLLSLRTVDP